MFSGHLFVTGMANRYHNAIVDALIIPRLLFPGRFNSIVAFHCYNAPSFSSNQVYSYVIERFRKDPLKQVSQTQFTWGPLEAESGRGWAASGFPQEMLCLIKHHNALNYLRFYSKMRARSYHPVCREIETPALKGLWDSPIFYFD